MNSHRLALAVVLALAACTEPSPQYPANMPPDIAQACAMTERKCTACHDRERFSEPRHSAAQWRDIVDKMRRIPGSSISPADADTVLRCLNYRSSTTSQDTWAPLASDVVAQGPRYVPLCGEVQALHSELHKPMHFVGPEHP